MVRHIFHIMINPTTRRDFLNISEIQPVPRTIWCWLWLPSTLNVGPSHWSSGALQYIIEESSCYRYLAFVRMQTTHVRVDPIQAPCRQKNFLICNWQNGRAIWFYCIWLKTDVGVVQPIYWNLIRSNIPLWICCIFKIYLNQSWSHCKIDCLIKSTINTIVYLFIIMFLIKW